MNIEQFDVAVLRVEPGDVVVAKVHVRINEAAANAVKAAVLAAFNRAGAELPEVLVLDDTIDLSVIRRGS